MTDRELLEKAAKAAGLRLEDDHVWHEGAGQWVRWNPLYDDGDAFRLAVQCRIDLGWVESQIAANNCCELGTDPYAATRRAIVRAAAAMAKEEKE